MAKIIGNTTATPTPRPDWNQADSTKADYIKNKPTVLTEEDVLGLIAGNTEVPMEQVQADWNQDDETKLDYIKNKPAVLTEDDVVELIVENTTSAVEQIQADWNQTDDTQVDYIKNKPIIVNKFSEGENGELLYNGDSIGGGLDTEYAEQIKANTAAKHTHENSDVLDNFGEVDGVVLYNGEQISGIGESGATFTPSVSEDGDLSWTNDKGLDNPTTVNIKGEQGNSGIYVGSGEMPDGYNIQIDPNGGVLVFPDKGYVIDKTLTQEGSAADAKVVGDKLYDLEHTVLSAEESYNHTNLPSGNKIISFVGNGEFGEYAYVSSGIDLIPRDGFDCSFPNNGITIVSQEDGYVLSGIPTSSNQSYYFVDSNNDAFIAIPDDFRSADDGDKWVKFRIFVSNNSEITEEAQCWIELEYYDIDKKIIATGKWNMETISRSLCIHENMRYIRVKIVVEGSGLTYNQKFQIYLFDGGENYTIEPNKDLNINIDPFVSYPYKTTVTYDTSLNYKVNHIETRLNQLMSKEGIVLYDKVTNEKYFVCVENGQLTLNKEAD